MQPIQEEIIALENRYWDAMRDDDVETAVSLTKFPCTLTGPNGAQKISESKYREIMKSMEGTRFQDVQLQNPDVTVLSDDTAMITYQIEMNGMKMLDVSTWVRDGGHWVCAFHSENPIQ